MTLIAKVAPAKVTNDAGVINVPPPSFIPGVLGASPAGLPVGFAKVNPGFLKGLLVKIFSIMFD